MVHNHVLPDENRVPMLAAAMREVARLEAQDVLREFQMQQRRGQRA